MAQKKLYTATISYEGGTDALEVDMLNLPYDMFGPDFPLEIRDDVDMGKCKGQILPDMTNVIVNGAFDCSTCTLTETSVLPRGITSLVCKHSIGSLDVLIGKLPDTVTTIVVRSAILTAVKDAAKKNSTDKTAYETALRFMELYPNIIVTDGKKTLHDVIDSCVEKAAEKPVVKSAVVEKESKPEQQTADWLSVTELVAVCEQMLSPDILEKLDKDLKRYIRQAMNSKNNIKIETREMCRADGSVVKCIHQEDAAHIVEYIAQSVASKSEPAAKPEKSKKSATKKAEAPVAQTAKKKYYIGSREICTVKIKKYISKAAWGQILSKVGKNTSALLKVLQDIEDINTNPALAHTASNQVVFIKDGAVHVSPTVGFKNGRCLAQGFGTLDDRPRIVWGICGNNFVCQNFYPAHEGKVKLEYNALLRTIDIDISKLDLSEYLLVSDLIKELSAERVVSETIEQEEVVQPVVKPASEVKSETKEIVAPVLIKEDVPVEKTVKPVEESEPQQQLQPIAQPEMKTEDPVPEQNKFKKQYVARTAPKTPYWASLYHLSAHINADYRATVAQQERLIAALSKPLDTEQMLDYTNELHEVLSHKKDLEWAKRQLEEKNKELFAFIEEIRGAIKR